jgi:hypothetical protein
MALELRAGTTFAFVQVVLRFLVLALRRGRARLLGLDDFSLGQRDWDV